MFHAIIALVLIILGVAESKADCGRYKTCVEIINNCSFPIWPGIQGTPLVEGGGFFLSSGTKKILSIPNGWSSGKIWARTGCDEQFNCETGSCGNSLHCAGHDGKPPYSVAEISLNQHKMTDSYRVSLVDGFNVPIAIDVVEGTYKLPKAPGDFDCKRAGGCSANLADDEHCPKELRYKVDGRTVGCRSACSAFDNDAFCCRGAHARWETCQSADWPVDYPAAVFKKACANVHAHVFGNCTQSSFSCPAKSGSAQYRVQFC